MKLGSRVAAATGFRSLTRAPAHLSTALREASAMAAAEGLRMSFEELLAQLQGGDTKRCDKDVGGCGAAAQVRHNLEQPPTVFTISLAWDTAQAPEEVVAATMKARARSLRLAAGSDRAARAQALRPELRPQQAFDNAPIGEARLYSLRAMVCYYGSHYAAYARVDTPDANSFLPPTCVIASRFAAAQRRVLTPPRAGRRGLGSMTPR